MLTARVICLFCRRGNTVCEMREYRHHFAGLVQILALPNWGVYPLVDNALVIDHTLKPAIDEGCTGCHGPMCHSGNFGGRAMALLNGRSPKVVWRESCRVVSQGKPGREGKELKRTALPFAAFPGTWSRTPSSSVWPVVGCHLGGFLRARVQGRNFPFPARGTKGKGL